MDKINSENVEVINCERGARISLTTLDDGSRELACERLRMMFVPGHSWLKCGDEGTLPCIYHEDWKSLKIKVHFPRD
ncbi:MAG: hypothetical protein JSV25_01945 [Spirochaetota bacterium]|nr:MAG: hypothetical protein JSV25_01945 [Spirochaetota bacterium]